MTAEAARLAQEHWNATPLYVTEEYRYTLYPWLYKAAEFEGHAGERVLEVGCGTGSDLLQFARHGALATGIDITAKHLELAKQRVGGLATVQYGDACAIPFEDNTFDYVYSHGVIHHMDRPELASREILRVLKPGGRFNVQVYAKWSYFTGWLLLRYQHRWKVHIENSRDPVHIDLYTKRMLRRLFGFWISIEKHHCWPIRALAPWLGWYLVAKGAKPGS